MTIILVNAYFTKLNNPIVVDATEQGDSGTERLPGDLMSVGGGLDSPAPPNLAELSGRRRPAGTASVRPCVCECARHISSTRHRLSWICQGTHLPLSSPLRKYIQYTFILSYMDLLDTSFIFSLNFKENYITGMSFEKKNCIRQDCIFCKALWL